MKNLSLILAPLISLIILIGFVGYYTIPPLDDFLAHVSMGMLHSPILSHYYYYVFSITYRLLDSVIRLWTWILGDHYARVSLASYLTIIGLIFSSTYSFFLLLQRSHKRAFCLLGIISGPMFLLLHTQAFIWGVIQYTLAVFMAATSGCAVWQLNNEIRETHTITSRTLAIFIIYTILAIFSHPSAFLYLGIAWLIPLIRVVYTRQYGAKRFLFLPIVLIICAVLSIFTLFPYANNPKNMYTLSEVLVLHLKWLLDGPYILRNLIPLSQEGLFGNLIFRMCLYIPYITLISFLGFRQKSDKSKWGFLLLAQLVFQLLLDIVFVKNFGELRALMSRHWLFMDAWIFMGMGYLVHRFNPKIFKVLTYCAPLFMIAALYVLNPIYANFRSVPVEQQVEHYDNVLIKAVNEYREAHPEEAKKIVVIDYTKHPFSPYWDHYHLIPFIMMNSQKLLNNGIIIREHWYFLNRLQNQQPIRWKEDMKFSSNVVYLYWACQDYSQIRLVRETPAIFKKISENNLPKISITPLRSKPITE